MKVTVSRLFEISKYLDTDSGKELEGALSYISEFAEVTVRGLRNNLTFEDNVDCEQKRISVRHNVETIVSIATRKRPVRIYLDRAVSQYYVTTGFGWQFNNAGQVIIKVLFDGPPPANTDINVDITIFYG